jgi:hypothetical protein
MRNLSAADAISPAIQRTREFLFSPFRWGTYLKLSLVAIVTEGLGSNLRSSSHGGQPSGHGPMITSPLSLHPEWIAAIIAAVLVSMVFFAVVFYVVTRLRFAYFHCLVTKSRDIGPGWRFYGPQAMRFFWLNVVVGLSFLFLAMVAAYPFVTGIVRLFHETPPGGHPDIGSMLILVLPIIPVVLLLVLLGVLADLVLRDCMLPHFALEDATAGEAWAQVWARILAEKRQFLAYALLRVVLPTIGMVALFIVLIIPGLVLVGSLGAIGYGIHAGFADATGGAAVAGFAIQALFGVIAFVLAVLASICVGGPLSTAVREFALVFYGGRYQLLGDLLYPPLPPTAIPGMPQIV